MGNNIVIDVAEGDEEDFQINYIVDDIINTHLRRADFGPGNSKTFRDYFRGLDVTFWEVNEAYYVVMKETEDEPREPFQNRRHFLWYLQNHPDYHVEDNEYFLSTDLLQSFSEAAERSRSAGSGDKHFEEIGPVDNSIKHLVTNCQRVALANAQELRNPFTAKSLKSRSVFLDIDTIFRALDTHMEGGYYEVLEHPFFFKEYLKAHPEFTVVRNFFQYSSSLIEEASAAKRLHAIERARAVQNNREESSSNDEDEASEVESKSSEDYTPQPDLKEACFTADGATPAIIESAELEEELFCELFESEDKTDLETMDAMVVFAMYVMKQSPATDHDSKMLLNPFTREPTRYHRIAILRYNVPPWSKKRLRLSVEFLDRFLRARPQFRIVGDCVQLVTELETEYHKKAADYMRTQAKMEEDLIMSTLGQMQDLPMTTVNGRFMDNPFTQRPTRFLRISVLFFKLPASFRESMDAESFKQHIRKYPELSVINDFVQSHQYLREEMLRLAANPSVDKYDYQARNKAVDEILKTLDPTESNSRTLTNPEHGTPATFFTVEAVFERLPEEFKQWMPHVNALLTHLRKNSKRFALVEDCVQSQEFLCSHKENGIIKPSVSVVLELGPNLGFDIAVLSMISFDFPVRPTVANSREVLCPVARGTRLFYLIAFIHGQLVKYNRNTPKTVEEFKEYLVFHPKFVLFGDLMRASDEVESSDVEVSSAESVSEDKAEEPVPSEAAKIEKNDLAGMNVRDKAIAAAVEWVANNPWDGSTRVVKHPDYETKVVGFKLYPVLSSLQLPRAQWFKGTRDFNAYLESRPDIYVMLDKSLFNLRTNLKSA